MNGPRSYTLTQGPSHDALSPNILLAVRSLRRVGLFATPWTAARQASLSVTVSWSLLRLLSTESVMPSTVNILLMFPFYRNLRTMWVERLTVVTQRGLVELSLEPKSSPKTHH